VSVAKIQLDKFADTCILHSVLRKVFMGFEKRVLDVLDSVIASDRVEFYNGTLFVTVSYEDTMYDVVEALSKEFPYLKVSTNRVEMNTYAVDFVA